MTISELIGDLEDLAADYGDDTEVRMANQPNWPFEYSIDSVVAADDDVDVPVVYIVEGEQLGYLPVDVTAELGW